MSLLFGSTAVLAAFVFLAAAIFMILWNHAIPRLADSADAAYDMDSDFTDIDYWTSLTAVILLGMIMSAPAILGLSMEIAARVGQEVLTPIRSVSASKSRSRSRSKRAQDYELPPIGDTL